MNIDATPDKPFNVKVWAGDKLVDSLDISDPFVNTCIRPSNGIGRFMTAWRALRGRLVYRVVVSGNHCGVYRAVMGADYEMPADDPMRRVVMSLNDQEAQ